MRRAQIDAQDHRMVMRQHQFRIAADILADAWSAFAEVAAVAVIGSVAKPLWREVPRFREFRGSRIEIWHECADLELALWLDSQARLDELRRAAAPPRRRASAALGVRGGNKPGHRDGTGGRLLFEPGSDRYLGRLCRFSECPKGNPECHTPGCGATPFNKVVPEFKPDASLLAPSHVLYRRGAGRVGSAVELPGPQTTERDARR